MGTRSKPNGSSMPPKVRRGAPELHALLVNLDRLGLHCQVLLQHAFDLPELLELVLHVLELFGQVAADAVELGDLLDQASVHNVPGPLNIHPLAPACVGGTGRQCQY